MKDQTRRNATSVETSPQMAETMPADIESTAQMKARRDDLSVASAYVANVERYWPQAGSSSSDLASDSGSNSVPGSNGFTDSRSSSGSNSDLPFKVIAGFLSAAVVCLLAGIALLVCGHRITGLAANATASTLSLIASALCLKETLRAAREAKKRAERFREIRAEIEWISGGSK